MVAVVGVAASAAAEPRISVHAAGTASGGFTDNVLSSPDDPAPDQAPPESDLFTELSPSALVVIDTPRTLSEISYGVRLLLFARLDEGNSINHQGDWRGLFLTSPLSRLAARARVRAGQTSALATDGGAADSLVGALPFGEESYVAAELEEIYSRQLDRDWTIEQTAVGELRSSGDSGGLELGAGAGVRRAYRQTEVGAATGARFIDLERAGESQQAALGDLRASFARDLGRRWNLRGEMGGRVLASVDDSFDPTFGPVGLLAATYAAELAELGATAEHTLEPSLFVGRNTIADRLVLRGRLPLWRDSAERPLAGLTGSVGYQRLEALALAGGEVEADADMFLGDLGAFWRASRDLSLSLRYQYRRQRGDAELADTLPSFERSTVILSLAAIYPRREIEQRQRQSPRIDERSPTLEGRE